MHPGKVRARSASAGGLIIAHHEGQAVISVVAGAAFDAATGVLTWTPSYDQAGRYLDVTLIAGDGQASVQAAFDITVEQGYAPAQLAPVAAQTLREGDAFALQLVGAIPGGLVQADGTRITLEYAAPLLPGGAKLNSETGWLEWTPGYAQAGTYRIPISLTATYSPADGEPVATRVSQDLQFQVLNGNGAPQFAVAETWNLLEGQPLRISVFAFDPDNPDFEPRVRLSPTAPGHRPGNTRSHRGLCGDRPARGRQLRP